MPLVHAAAVLAQLSCQLVITYFAPLYLHTSAPSEADWVHELLTGDPQCIQNELDVSRATFTVLLKAIRTLGPQSSCHVSIEEQLSIFLYTVVTCLPCTHVGVFSAVTSHN
jgi:hypothetical protein